jgi:PPM family protein phosphatase
VRRATRYAARSDAGLVRSDNEDRWLAREYAGTLLLAVADGVGGEPGGELASEAAIGALARSFAAPGFNESARGALSSAVQAANASVLGGAGAAASPSGATTLVAAAVRGREAAIANLGDSRAYVVRGGEARQVTTDHRGDREHSITRFVGDPRGVQPDIFVERLRPDDRVVLCSDGLTLHVTDAEIGRAAMAAPEQAAGSLVALARERGGQDNVTVVIYATPRRSFPRALVGTLVLALLILLVIAGTLVALVTTAPPPPPPPLPLLPAVSPTP